MRLQFANGEFDLPDIPRVDPPSTPGYERFWKIGILSNGFSLLCREDGKLFEQYEPGYSCSEINLKYKKLHWPQMLKRAVEIDPCTPLQNWP